MRERESACEKEIIRAQKKGERRPNYLSVSGPRYPAYQSSPAQPSYYPPTTRNTSRVLLTLPCVALQLEPGQVALNGLGLLALMSLCFLLFDLNI